MDAGSARGRRACTHVPLRMSMKSPARRSTSCADGMRKKFCTAHGALLSRTARDAAHCGMQHPVGEADATDWAGDRRRARPTARPIGREAQQRPQRRSPLPDGQHRVAMHCATRLGLATRWRLAGGLMGGEGGEGGKGGRGRGGGGVPRRPYGAWCTLGGAGTSHDHVGESGPRSALLWLSSTP